MSDITIEYLENQISSTFAEHTQDRRILNVDWFESIGDVRAAIYLSRKLEDVDMQEVTSHMAGQSIVDLILLCPPLPKEKFE